MSFKVEREEYVNKTFRMEKKLVEEMHTVCEAKNISMNKLVALCIRYALDEMEEEPEENMAESQQDNISE